MPTAKGKRQIFVTERTRSALARLCRPRIQVADIHLHGKVANHSACVVKHDAIATLTKSSKSSPFHLVSIGKDAAAHNIEKYIGEMMDRRVFCAENCKPSAAATITDQFGGPFVNICFNLLFDSKLFLVKEMD